MWWIYCVLLLFVVGVQSGAVYGPATSEMGRVVTFANTLGTLVDQPEAEVRFNWDNALVCPYGIRLPFSSYTTVMEKYLQYNIQGGWTVLTNSGITISTVSSRTTFTRVGNTVYMNIKGFATTITDANVNRFQTGIPEPFRPDVSIFQNDRIKNNGSLKSATIEIRTDGYLWIYAGIDATSTFTGDSGVLGHLNLEWTVDSI